MKKVPEFGTVESFPVWTKGFTLLVQPIALKKMPEHSKTLLAPSQLGRPDSGERAGLGSCGIEI